MHDNNDNNIAATKKILFIVYKIFLGGTFLPPMGGIGMFPHQQRIGYTIIIGKSFCFIAQYDFTNSLFYLSKKEIISNPEADRGEDKNPLYLKNYFVQSIAAINRREHLNSNLLFPAHIHLKDF